MLSVLTLYDRDTLPLTELLLTLDNLNGNRNNTSTYLTGLLGTLR